jgi:hypothetical protein
MSSSAPPGDRGRSCDLARCFLIMDSTGAVCTAFKLDVPHSVGLTLAANASLQDCIRRVAVSTRTPGR